MKNKIWSAILSVAVAFGLWLYVVNYVSPESENTFHNIPVVFEGETVLSERGLMITSGNTAYVTLNISGNRSDLNKINSSNITVKVDLTKVYDPGELNLSYASISYPGNVSQSAYTVESKSPQTVKITVERRQTKPVDVRVVFNGSVPEGFIADTENYTLDAPIIYVTGPSSVIEQIDHAQVDVDLNEQMESISQNCRYTLCDQEGNPVDVEMVTTDVAEVRLDVKIQRYKEMKLKLNVTYGGGASESNTDIEIQPASINIAGSEALLAELDEFVLGSVDLSTMEEDSVLSYTVVLPEGVTNVTGVNEVTATIRFVGLSVREFDVTNITAINVPEGYTYELMNRVMKIKLRGLTGLMYNIDPEDIIVEVDFTGKEAGTFSIKPNIRVEGESFSSVGAVGSYTVSVTLSEEAPEDE